uniref:Uncharacterized protein n=1 Tax=Caenorhabditis japonica TaxID=281687 RepID=A0A8R1IKR4_CAEJA
MFRHAPGAHGANGQRVVTLVEIVELSSGRGRAPPPPQPLGARVL